MVVVDTECPLPAQKGSDEVRVSMGHDLLHRWSSGLGLSGFSCQRALSGYAANTMACVHDPFHAGSFMTHVLQMHSRTAMSRAAH